ncbi:hypothetical protein ACJMK2_004307 [Sinanodonta woodiana]|uniref:C-type lectin domain-containing protein n=1 Tax=Sinanodonta woodiana TaxID=1069815 RepID=A0ABD3Y0R6_SINWO
MGIIITLSFLIMFQQFLTRVSYVNSNGVDCNENSVNIEEQGSKYHGVNLLVGNSCCQRIIQRDTENAMKKLCAGMSNETDVNERNKALNTKIDVVEKKVDKLVQTALNIIGKCPTGYDYYEQDNFCYKFNSECKTWSEAQQVCQQEGGDLISLKDGNFNFFRNLVISIDGVCSSVWVGSTDIAVEGQWKWLNGENVTSSMWQPGQPDNWDNKEHCGDLAKLADYRLNDEDCSKKVHFLCQIV